MTQKKTIQINGYYFRALFLTFVLSYLAIFATEHFGDFKYSHYRKVVSETPIEGLEGVTRLTYDWDRDDPVTAIQFNTILGSRIMFPSDGWKIKDLDNVYSPFYDYNNKFKYYNRAVVKEIKYVFLLWIVTMLIILFSRKIKIKFT